MGQNLFNYVKPKIKEFKPSPKQKIDYDKFAQEESEKRPLWKQWAEKLVDIPLGVGEGLLGADPDPERNDVRDWTNLGTQALTAGLFPKMPKVRGLLTGKIHPDRIAHVTRAEKLATDRATAEKEVGEIFSNIDKKYPPKKTTGRILSDRKPYVDINKLEEKGPIGKSPLVARYGARGPSGLSDRKPYVRPTLVDQLKTSVEDLRKKTTRLREKSPLDEVFGEDSELPRMSQEQLVQEEYDKLTRIKDRNLTEEEMDKAHKLYKILKALKDKKK